MKIYLSSSTAGRGGGAGLRGMLKHLDRHIQTSFDQANFQSSFEELWITLAYPPMYVLPGVAGMEVGFANHYQKLPVSRLDRRNKRIEVTVQAPEFSEHFDKEAHGKYKDQFPVEARYQHLDELTLSKILVDKYIEAGEIISKKIKKDDAFDSSQYVSLLESVKSEISPEYLAAIDKQQQLNVHQEVLQTALELREKRSHQKKEKNTIIRDVRVYYHDLPNKALYPYDYQFTEIFRNILTRKQFKCPDYHHLYILAAESEEEALKQSVAMEDWYVCGISTFDFKDYSQKNETEKAETVFQLIVNGLKDISKIDGLDEAMLDETIAEIRKDKLDTELTYGVYEHKRYSLKITYLSRSMEEECPVFFNIVEHETGREKRMQIGKADNSQIRFWLQKVTLTNKSIKVKSSDSIRGQVWLKDKPRTMEFSLEELLA